MVDQDRVSDDRAVTPRSVLAIGAHPDDIELGCGGTLLRHLEAGDRVTMLVMTGGELGSQGSESRWVEAQRAADILGADLVQGPFHDGSLPLGAEPVRLIEDLIRRLEVDTLYVHHPSDAHQDHMGVARATIAAARRTRRVLFYQSPSTTEFDATIFVDVSAQVETKIEALQCHSSQVGSTPTMQMDVVAASARYWGARGQLRDAEAFVPYRFVWNIDARQHIDLEWDRPMHGHAPTSPGRNGITSTPVESQV